MLEHNAIGRDCARTLRCANILLDLALRPHQAEASEIRKSGFSPWADVSGSAWPPQIVNLNFVSTSCPKDPGAAQKHSVSGMHWKSRSQPRTWRAVYGLKRFNCSKEILSGLPTAVPMSVCMICCRSVRSATASLLPPVHEAHQTRCGDNRYSASMHAHWRCNGLLLAHSLVSNATVSITVLHMNR